MAQGSSTEDIARLLGDQVFIDQVRITDLIDKTTESAQRLVDTMKSIGGGGSGLSNAVNAQGQLVQLQREANKAIEDSKRVKSEERELNRLIAEEERALRKQQQAEEKELTRLIRIEASERARVTRDSVRQANKEKADSDRAYIAQWKKLLQEKEREDKDANKRMTEEAKRAAKAAVDAVDPTSLKAMSDRLEGLRAGYQRLTQAERENVQIGGVVLARIKELDTALKAADASQGKFNRNVGNYKSAYAGSGLDTSIQQILREAPAAANSINTFFLAISNNLPIFFDELKRAKAAIKEASLESQRAIKTAVEEAEARALAAGQTNAQAKAAGKLAAAEAVSTAEAVRAAALARSEAEARALATGATQAQATAAGELAATQTLANNATKPAAGILSTLGRSIFSINTALTVGVTLITFFGGAIFKALGSLVGFSKEASKLSESQKEYAETQKRIAEGYAKEAVALEVNRAKIESFNVPMKIRIQAVKDLQDKFPTYFGQLTQEAILMGKVGDAYAKANESILARARVRTYSDELEKNAAKMIQIQDRIENASKNSFYGITKDEYGFYDFENDDAATGGKFELKYKTGETDKDGNAVWGSLEKDVRAYNSALSANLDLLEKIKTLTPQAAVDLDRKITDPKTKAPKDLTNETLQAETDLTQSLFKQFKQRSEQSAKEQLAIATDETNNLEKRAEAYDNYTANRLNTAGAEAAAEQTIIRTKLKKIAEIEAKSVDKRTNEEKRLLLSKRALEVDLVTATESFEAQRTEIISENTRLQLGLLKQYGKEANAVLTTEQKNFSSVGESFKGIRGQSETREEYEARIERRRQMNIQAAQDSVRVEQEILAIVADANRAKLAEIDAEIAKRKLLGEVQRKEILNSGKTEAEQKELLAALDARLANEEFQLNERKRAQQVRNARFEKAANIALLIQETAIAVVRALGSKPYTPANIGLAIGVGAIGAANIARAVAAPLPEYREGTGPLGAPRSGLALVGDGYRPEVIERQDGSIEITPARPTVDYLRKGEIVHKSVEDYVSKAQAMSINGIPVLRPYNERISTKKMENKLDRIARGIENLNQKDLVNIQMNNPFWNQYLSDIYH